MGIAVNIKNPMKLGSKYRYPVIASFLAALLIRFLGCFFTEAAMLHLLLFHICPYPQAGIS